MFSVLAAILFSLQPPAPVDCDLEVKVDHPGKVGRYLALHACTKGETVIWRALDPGVDFLEPELAPKDTRISGVIADAPGKYRMLAITAIGGKPAVCEFIVEFVGRVPPVPVPPTPPPAPNDPLVSKLQACYSVDPTPSLPRSRQKDSLEGLYAAMAEHAKDQSIKTTGDLLGDLRKISGQMIVPSLLIECRKIIAAEVLATLGPDDGKNLLDPVLRPKAIEVFSRISTALHGVK